MLQCRALYKSAKCSGHDLLPQLELEAGQGTCAAPLLCRPQFWWRATLIGLTAGLGLYGLYLQNDGSTTVS